MKRAAILLSVLFISLHAWAGGNVENGGDGVIRNDKLYLLDLVEYGIELSPYAGGPFDADKSIQKQVDNNFTTEVDHRTRQIVATQLTRMKRHYRTLYKQVMRTFNNRIWLFVTDPLDVRGDVDTAISHSQLVRVASHDKTHVRVNIDAFKRLSQEHRAALITHELIYASRDADETSKQTRLINSFFYDPAYHRDSESDRQELRKRLSFDFASSADMPLVDASKRYVSCGCELEKRCGMGKCRYRAYAYGFLKVANGLTQEHITLASRIASSTEERATAKCLNALEPLYEKGICGF